VLGLVLVMRRHSHVPGGHLEARILIISTVAVVTVLHLKQDSSGISTLTSTVGIVLEIVFLLLLVVIYRSGRKKTSVLEELKDHITSASTKNTISLLVFGTLGLWLGGKVLVDGAVSLARLLDIQESTIGLTIVAAGTGAPELFASLAALRKGSASIAIGNVVGSNLFNTIAIVGAAAIVNPLKIRLEELHWDLGVMIIMTICIVPVLSSGKSPRLQKSLGAFLLALYALWLLWTVIEKH